jgi:hypothetical protein
MEFMEFTSEAEKREHRSLVLKTRKALNLRFGSAAAAQLPPELRTRSGFVVKSIHGEDLAAEPGTGWLWQDRLPAGTFSLLVAKPKVGKSTLARQLAWSVARGLPLFGGDVQKGSVIYLPLEERPQDVHASFSALGLTGSEDIHCAYAATVESAMDAVTEFRPVLIVVDPLFLLLDVKDENAYVAMYKALRPLIDIARTTGTHILGLHHAPKISRRDTIDSALGSTALGAAASTLLVMRKIADRRTIESVQRMGQNMAETFLSFDSIARRFDLGEARSLDEEAKREQVLMEALDNEAELTEQQIRSQVVGRTTGKSKTLRKLIAEGEIERDGSGRRGDPYRYRISRSLVPASEME